MDLMPCHVICEAVLCSSTHIVDIMAEDAAWAAALDVGEESKAIASERPARRFATHQWEGGEGGRRGGDGGCGGILLRTFNDC